MFLEAASIALTLAIRSCRKEKENDEPRLGFEEAEGERAAGAGSGHTPAPAAPSQVLQRPWLNERHNLQEVCTTASTVCLYYNATKCCSA